MARKSYDQIPHDERLLVRRERTRAGLTLDELAERIGTTRQHLQRMETGQRNISLEWLAKIAGALDVPIARLIQGGDGLTDEERDLVAFIRANPVHRKIILSTYATLKDAGPDMAAK